MDFDYKIQFNSKNKLEHFLNIELLNAQHINEIIALAEYYDNEDGSGDYNWFDDSGELVAETDSEFYEYYYGDLITLYNEEEVDKLGFQYEASVVLGVDYYLYEKKYWVHGWASVIPYSKGLTPHAFQYETGDIDFDIGLVAGWKFNRNLGVFGEGRYLRYFGIDAYELKAGLNFTIF